MPQALQVVVASNPLFDRLPFSVEQKSSRASALIMLLLLIPAVVTILVPVGLLAAFATQTFGAAVEHPEAAAQVGLGFGVWTLLFVLPAKRLIQRFGTARQVRIEMGLVTVRERGIFGARGWAAPLSEFSGVTHHVRSTLSGVQHELFLVHSDRSKSVLLHAGAQIPHASIEGAAALFGLPHVPAGALYRFGQARASRPTRSTELAQPLAA
jgi:hypothetical protein